MKSIKTVLVTTLFASLASLSAQATVMENSSNDEITKVIYSCPKKQTLEVIYINTDKSSYAIINQVDEMIPMQEQRTGSGAYYKAMNKNYTYELFTKGNTAELYGDKKVILANCVDHK